MSKILEKVVYKQPDEYLSIHNIYDTFQSVFRANHSTETALISVIIDLKINSDSQRISILVFLDLTAAFDTDRDILIQRLHDSVGLACPVLFWFSSYLKDRSFYVSVGSFKSTEISGVPQG